MRSFIDYLQAIHVGGIVDSCKISCKGNFLDCQATDEDVSMKLETSHKIKIKGFDKGQMIAIYDLSKLIQMLSYSEEDSNMKYGKIWIEIDNENEDHLYYDGLEKKVDYRLADPDLIENLDIEKTIGDFNDEEEVEFELSAVQMRELIKGLGIISSEFIRIYIRDKHIYAEIGEIDKLTIKIEKFKNISGKTADDLDGMSVYLDSKNLSAILRTALQLKGTVRFAIRENYPAVVHFGNIKDISAAYLISPARIEE